MKTPEAIKEGLVRHFSFDCDLMGCPYVGERRCGETLASHALCYIKQLESNYSQVSKALCSKENATLDEVLQAVSQVKAEFAAAKRERDAAVAIIGRISGCSECANADKRPTRCLPAPDDWCDECEENCVCKFCNELDRRWIWRGVFPENTEVQGDE